MIPVDAIRTRIKGRLIEPGDPDYDGARTVFVGGIDRRPSLIVRPADATNVAAAISLAQEDGLELAVRSGGHSATGFGVTDGPRGDGCASAGGEQVSRGAHDAGSNVRSRFPRRHQWKR